MKIVAVHNRYKIKGGEDSVFDAETSLLESHGIDVVRFVKTNNKLGLLDTLKLIFSTHYSKSNFQEFSTLLKKEVPDIVHVHNFFPQFTPSIFYACKKLKIPCVLSLHNFRIMYPNGLLFHNGKIDHRTIRGSAYATIKDKVYRNSFLQTAVVAFMIEFHKKRGTWKNVVDGFITFSEHSKSIFEEFGLPRDKIYIKPHFVNSQITNLLEKKNYYVYVGRISDEKGISELLEIWDKLYPELRVIGDGPLNRNLQGKYLNNENISFLGRLEKNDLLKEIGSARAVVFPSKCYESFGMIVAEAFSMGTPVIMNKIGNQALLVKDGLNGFHFHLGNPGSLCDLIQKIESKPEQLIELSKNALETYRSNYTPDVNLHKLLEIYNNIINSKEYDTVGSN